MTNTQTKLTTALETVIEEVFDRHFTKTECRVIAMGMLTYALAKNIPVMRLFEDSKVFIEVMAGAVAIMVEKGAMEMPVG